MTRRKTTRGSRATARSGSWSLPAVLMALAIGCGTPPAKAPGKPPPIGPGAQPPGRGAGNVQKASSAKVQQGIDAIQASDFAKAKAVLAEAHAAHPADPQAAFYLGVADEGLGDKKAAADLYRQALGLDPRLTEASVNLSALLLDQNNPGEALKVARQGLRTAPKHAGLLMNLALATEASGDKVATLKAYRNAVAASPDNMELRYAYAENLAAAGQTDQAIEQLRRAVVTDNVKLITAIGDLYARMHKFGECVGALDKAIKAQPSAGLYVLRGRCRHGLKDIEGEKADYEQAIKLDDKLASPHFYLGQLYKVAGKKKEALAELQKASDLGGDKKVGVAARKAIAVLKSGR